MSSAVLPAAVADACLEGNVMAVMDYLSQDTEHVHARVDALGVHDRVGGATLLHLVVASLHNAMRACITPLLHMHADVNATMADGRTTLHLAAASGQASVVKQLLQVGAQPHVLTNRQQYGEAVAAADEAVSHLDVLYSCLSRRERMGAVYSARLLNGVPSSPPAAAAPLAPPVPSGSPSPHDSPQPPSSQLSQLPPSPLSPTVFAGAFVPHPDSP